MGRHHPTPASGTSPYVSPLSTPERRRPGVARPVGSSVPTTPEFSDDPPSYSSTERPGIPVAETRISRDSRRFNLIMGHRGDMGGRGSYFHRTPPPSYSESELHSTGDGAQIVDMTTACLPILWTRHPRFTTCPSCGTRSVTEVHLHCSRNTHLAALALCLCGCWPFCLLPYAAAACKAAHHHCRRCHYLIGVYDPWTQHNGW